MLLLTKTKGHMSNVHYSGFPKHLQTKSNLHISISQSKLKHKHLPLYVTVSVGFFSSIKVQGRKIPGFIKKLNKFLGLPTKSEQVMDILSISDLKTNLSVDSANINNNAGNIEKNMADILKYHPGPRKWLHIKKLVLTGLKFDQ